MEGKYFTKEDWLFREINSDTEAALTVFLYLDGTSLHVLVSQHFHLKQTVVLSKEKRKESVFRCLPSRGANH